MKLARSNRKVLFKLLYTLSNYNSDYHPFNRRTINHDKKLVFIHNPKVAGTSLKRVFGVGSNHNYPSLLVSKHIWETYTTIVAVRHPIDRFISGFKYHTHESYTGELYRMFPTIHSMDPHWYFEMVKKDHYIVPQVCYTVHYFSNKPVDFIIRYESLEDDVRYVCESVGIPFNGLPHHNASKSKLNVEDLDLSLIRKLNSFYKKDFEAFGYKPIPV